MADFRKVSVLVALVLLMGMATTASAQATPPLTCTANAAVPPLLRAEGFTELTGDIVLDCTGGTPTLAGTAVPTVNFQLFYTAIVTSRTYSTSSPAPSEALLIIDEHSGAALRACTAQIGCGLLGTGAGGPDPYDGSATRPNVFQGSVSSNSVQFIGVPVDPPGTTAHR